MTALPPRYFSEEEYLELERSAPYKSQYVAGEIFAMAGAQPRHVEITDNLTALLRQQLRGQPCRSYSSDLRVHVPGAALWTYPDITIVCGEPEFDRRAEPPSLLNPQVIFEVLSPSTEAFDRGDKFARYRLIPSLTDYVLVSADRVRVEHFVRQAEGAWSFREYHDPVQHLPITSANCELSLAEIYESVSFERTV